MADSPSPRTSPTLLDRLRDGGDALAWDDFFAAYGGLLWAYARRRGCSEATAEDVVQEAMLRVFERRDVFRYDAARGRFRDWLGAVVRNQVASLRRRPQERPRPTGDLASAPAEDADAAGAAGAFGEPVASGGAADAEWEDAFEKGLLAAALDIVRGEVEPRDYLAFELSEIEEVEPSRAAAAAGITRNALYKARRRILARLRELIAPYGEDGRLPARLREALAAGPPPAAARSLTARVLGTRGGGTA